MQKCFRFFVCFTLTQFSMDMQEAAKQSNPPACHPVGSYDVPHQSVSPRNRDHVFVNEARGEISCLLGLLMIFGSLLCLCLVASCWVAVVALAIAMEGPDD